MHYSDEAENIYTILRQIYFQENMCKILSESARFCRRCDKKFWFEFFGFTVANLMFTYKMHTLSFTR